MARTKRTSRKSKCKSKASAYVWMLRKVQRHGANAFLITQLSEERDEVLHTDGSCIATYRVKGVKGTGENPALQLHQDGFIRLRTGSLGERPTGTFELTDKFYQYLHGDVMARSVAARSDQEAVRGENTHSQVPSGSAAAIGTDTPSDNSLDSPSKLAADKRKREENVQAIEAESVAKKQRIEAGAVQLQIDQESFLHERTLIMQKLEADRIRLDDDRKRFEASSRDMTQSLQATLTESRRWSVWVLGLALLVAVNEVVN